MMSEEINRQCDEMYSLRLAEKVGFEVQIWHRLENGSYQQMFITDIRRASETSAARLRCWFDTD